MEQFKMQVRDSNVSTKTKKEEDTQESDEQLEEIGFKERIVAFTGLYELLTKK